MPDYREFGQQDDPQFPEGDNSFTGVNARLAPEQLGPGLLADAQNMRLRTGQPETRAGLVKPGWLNVTRAGVDTAIRAVGAFYGVGNYKDPNGKEWVLIVADGQVYRCTPNNERFALGLPVGVSLLSTCVPVQAFNQVFLFRGRNLQPLVMSDIAVGFLDVLPRWSAATVYQAAVQAAGVAAKEVAYGPFQTIPAAGLTSVGQTATVVTVVEHGLVTGADIVLFGANEAGYNGRWTITVLDVNTFTFPFPGAASPATGTIKFSNMALYWQALGTRRALTGITRVGAVATASSVGHGFSNGQSAAILGATGADGALYNGVFVIQNSLANTFDYVMSGTPTGAATGSPLTARTSVVLAGQSPDTNPEAWQQIFNVLPNADDALFVDNRLLVPTAYTPGANGYDATTVYTKKDFIVAMDIGDNVHFFFTDELRINQGGADEIVSLVKFDNDTVVVIKGSSWGILTGLSGGDLTTVRLDLRVNTYGGCAPRSSIVAGRNVLFPSTQRGICSLQQNQLGETRSVDIPFSNDLERVIARIDWRLADKIRLAWWDDKLYIAVALKDGSVRGTNIIPAGAAYNALPGLGAQYSYDITSLLVPGQTYTYTPGPNDSGLVISYGIFTFTVITKASQFVFNSSIVSARLFNSTPLPVFGPYPPLPVTASLALAGLPKVNNAILVYDFRRGSTGASFSLDFQAGAWDGYDTGSGVCVKEFFLATYGGKQRLFFIAEDGYCNMMEEGQGVDQVGDVLSAGGLASEQITTSLDTRGYTAQNQGLRWFKAIDLGISVWNAKFTVTAMTGQVSFLKPVRTNYTFSRTRYLKPLGKPDYVEGNVNGDFAQQGRGDYSVRMLPGGVSQGYSTDQFQEVTVATSIRATQGRFVQFRIVNSQGRLRLKSVAPSSADGMRREGVLI